MSRIPDERPSEAGLDRFDDLPILTAYTTLVDDEHVVEDCNDQFRDRLGRPRSAIVGEPLRAFYDSAGVPDGSAADGDGRRGTRFDGGDSVPVRESHPRIGSRDGAAADDRSGWSSACAERSLIAANGHLIHTLAEAVPRRNADGRAVFHVDITRRERREKQVGVLNRLLRHNVRNDLNLLRGYARTLRDQDDDDVVAAGRVIDRIADRWLDLAEKGRKIEDLSGTTPRQTVPLGDLLTAVRATIERDYPEGRVTVEFDGIPPDTAVAEQWYVAVVELCENGVKHTPTDAADGESSAPVTVTATSGSRPGWVVIAVADQGPGIPPDERIPLRGDPETPLRHGSGLGTWLVRFVVEQFGGRVTVEDRETGGSVVELLLPSPDDDSGQGSRCP